MSVESNAVEKMRKALSDFSPVWEDVIALTSAHGDAVIGVRAGEDEETALHTAAYWGEIDAINVLLGAGSDVSARNRTGATPLHLCALNSRSEAIRVLVEKGNADLSICDEAGFQPLHTAVSVGDLKTAETLLSLGASITAGVAKNGNSPCHVAAREGFIDVLQMLLDKGGEKVLSAKNDAQEVALHRAAAHGQREAAAVLIKAGADVNSKDANGDTPLHLAAMFGMEETAGELIALGATVDAIDEDEQTPLHLAVEAREQSAACALVRHGASCELKNEEGKSPRDIAAGHGLDEVLEAMTTAS